jgi:predicted lactoylglutathione lyase
MKKLEIGVDNINSKKPLFTNIIFNQPNQSKKLFEPINTDGNINYNSDAQTINIIHKNNVITLKNEDHIQNRLKKKIIKQKTNSVQINSKNIIFYTICNSHDCKTAKNTFSKKNHIK